MLSLASNCVRQHAKSTATGHRYLRSHPPQKAQLLTSPLPSLRGDEALWTMKYLLALLPLIVVAASRQQTGVTSSAVGSKGNNLLRAGHRSTSTASRHLLSALTWVQRIMMNMGGTPEEFLTNLLLKGDITEKQYDVITKQALSQRHVGQH